MAERHAGLEGLRNIGPVTAERLRAVGVPTPADLERLGSVEVYRRVKARYRRDTSLVLLWALEGAIWDLPWNELPPELKERLRRELAG